MDWSRLLACPKREFVCYTNYFSVVLITVAAVEVVVVRHWIIGSKQLFQMNKEKIRTNRTYVHSL